MPTPTQDLLEQVFAIAKDAGEAIMVVYARDFSVRRRQTRAH